MLTEYVLGFVYDYQKNLVLLQQADNEKIRGLWNGVGGKIKEREQPIEAMVRELNEEVSFVHPLDSNELRYPVFLNWEHKITYVCQQFKGIVYIFSGEVERSDIQCVDKTGRQGLSWFDWRRLPEEDINENIRWMVPLACKESLAQPVIVHGQWV